MKKLLIVLSLAIIAILSTSCRSGYINLTNDDQAVIIDKAGGYVSPERFTNIKMGEDHRDQTLIRTDMLNGNLKHYNESLQTMYDIQKECVASGNLAKLDSINLAIERMLYLSPDNAYGGGGGSGSSTRLDVAWVVFKNNSNFWVTFRNGPLAGKKLAPGQSYNNGQRVPVAFGPLKLIWEKWDGNSKGRYTIEHDVQTINKGEREVTF